MKPALTNFFQYIASAGLLLAAATCAADNTAPTPVTDTATAISTVANTAAISQHNITAQPASQLPQSQQSPPLANTQLPSPSPSTNSQPQSAQSSAPVLYQNSNSPKIGSGAHLLNVTLGLALIVGLILGISWFVKRFSQGAFAGNSYLKIIATMPLGTRERIALIDAGGKQLLIGVTPTNINTLHVFEVPVTRPAGGGGDDSGDINSSEFGRKLMAILQRPSNPADENNNSGNRS